MTDREDLTHLALDFLKDVAACAESQLSKNPQRVQYSEWMVRTGPGSMHSERFERTVPDRSGISMAYQVRMLHDHGSTAQNRLVDALVERGIERSHTAFGYLLPLVHAWAECENPLDLDGAAVSRVLEGFFDAVIDSVVWVKASYALTPLTLETGSVVLQEGVCVRPIREEELWESGNVDPLLMTIPHSGTWTSMPSEEWKILEITLQCDPGQPESLGRIYAIRESAIVAMGIASAGHLEVIELGRRQDFGLGAIGRTRTLGPTPRQLGRWGSPYVLDEVMAGRLVQLWPRLTTIMTSARNDLRIPAQRLVDGGGRNRGDDAVIDYAIGLEALLPEDAGSELSYRFALRGATILSWNGGDRKKAFDELRDFYDVRSKIVHGGRLASAKVSSARSTGEKALRDIWWWFFDRGESVSKATLKIDERVES